MAFLISDWVAFARQVLGNVSKCPGYNYAYVVGLVLEALWHKWCLGLFVCMFGGIVKDYSSQLCVKHIVSKCFMKYPQQVVLHHG